MSQRRYGLGGHRGPCGGDGVEPSYIEVSEPMDWEDISQVRASKRSKVSEPIELNITLQDEAAFPVSKKVKLTSPTPQKVSPLTSEFIRHKIRCKPKITEDRFCKKTRTVTEEKWQRWSTSPNKQRTVSAPSVSGRRSSSNWKMKILFVDMTRSSSSWPRKRAGYFCCGRVDPRPIPSTHDSCSILPDLETRQLDTFLIGVLVKGMSHDLTSPGLSRMSISGERVGRTALEEQQVADLQVVFLGQRCSPINGEQRLTGYFQI
ncbi:hypothetical protein TNCV_3723771 [Trichonephila clavipes]|nr:hypothetical protein TNCV_3723771 [Trichonephila clavipes]